MSRGTRSRASRADRRLHKERAAHALQHGLPVPMPKRVSERARLSSNPAGQGHLAAAGVPIQRMPLAVKLLGLGLGLLGLVYGLTLLRDHKSSPEPALTPAIGTNAAK